MIRPKEDDQSTISWLASPRILTFLMIHPQRKRPVNKQLTRTSADFHLLGPRVIRPKEDERINNQLTRISVDSYLPVRVIRWKTTTNHRQSNLRLRGFFSLTRSAWSAERRRPIILNLFCVSRIFFTYPVRVIRRKEDDPAGIWPLARTLAPPEGTAAQF